MYVTWRGRWPGRTGESLWDVSYSELNPSLESWTVIRMLSPWSITSRTCFVSVHCRSFEAPPLQLVAAKNLEHDLKMNDVPYAQHGWW